jgi:flagellar hook-length control protein FliK
MTIVITPMQAKAPVRSDSTAGTSTTEAPAADADFARLLLGQIAADANLIPETPVATPLPDTKALDTDVLDPAASAQDAASLLASLGMTPPQQNVKVETSDIEAGSETLLDVNTRLISKDKNFSAFTPVPLAGMPSSSDAAQPETVIEASSPASSGLSNPLELGGKAAKFAGGDFTTPKTDVLAIKNLPNDAIGPQVPVAAAPSPSPPVNTSSPLRVDTPIRDPAWSNDFSQKVVWLTSNEQKFAQLTLNPPQMGPIEISININKDSASAYFVSPNADVREAIETALPRLREMLAGVGIELGQANVSAQSSRQEADNPDKRQGVPRWMSDEAILGRDSGLGQTAIARRGNGLVDTFA